MKGLVFSLCLLFSISVFADSLTTPQIINLKDSDVIAVDLGPIPVGLKPPQKGLMSAADDWALLLLTVGYESYELPDDPTFTCWEPIDTYFRNKNVFFGTVIANFDSVAHNVPIRWELTGSKAVTVNVKKNAPALRVTAYYLIKTLVNDIGVYQINAKAFQPMPGFTAPGKLIDEIWARFVINKFIG